MCRGTRLDLPTALSDSERNYHLFAYSNAGGGGIRQTAPDEAPGSIPTVHVEDAQAAYDAALAAGAESVRPPTKIMDGVCTALVRALGGVLIGFSDPLSVPLVIAERLIDRASGPPLVLAGPSGGLPLPATQQGQHRLPAHGQRHDSALCTRKGFPGGVVAVRDVNLEVEPGELVVLVEPSGCGKSTVLRMVAGLGAVTAGEVRIAGRVATGLPRGIAMSRCSSRTRAGCAHDRAGEHGLRIEDGGRY